MQENTDKKSWLFRIDDLLAAGVLPWRNDEAEALAAIRSRPYRRIAAGVEWGGPEPHTIAIAGLGEPVSDVPFGSPREIIFGKKIDPHCPQDAAEEIGRLVRAFGCQRLVHNATGAGSLHASYLRSAVSPAMIDGAIYMRGNLRVAPSQEYWVGNIGIYDPWMQQWRIEKARSLILLAHRLKDGCVKFFKRDCEDLRYLGIVSELAFLMEERRDICGGEDLAVVTCVDGQAGFANAVNFACFGVIDLR